jgi:hypothetical protein
LNPFVLTSIQIQEEEKEEDLVRVTLEMSALASAMSERDWGFDHEADHLWPMEEDWEYARQNPERMKENMSGLPKLRPKLGRKSCMKTNIFVSSNKTRGISAER